MTDSEKLDLLITKVITIEDKFGTFEDKFETLANEVGTLTGKVGTLEERIGTLENDVSGLKKQMIKSTKELKAMDEGILKEVERVHSILNRHKEDKNAHVALLRYE